MKLECGCTPDASGYGYCSKCVSALRQKIWNKMSEKKRNYDRYVAPSQSKELDEGMPDKQNKKSYEVMPDEYNTGCSCHINPPCSYCTDKKEEEEE